MGRTVGVYRGEEHGPEGREPVVLADVDSRHEGRGDEGYEGGDDG